MTVQEQLRTLVRTHHAHFNEQIATVDRLLNGKDADGLCSNAAVVEAQGITHQMKGTAGSMGFAELSGVSADLDAALKRLKELNGPVAAEQMQNALGVLHKLREIADRTTPEMSALYNADLSQLTR